MTGFRARFAALDFLVRFSAVLLVVTVGAAAALSYLFTRSHMEALQQDLIASAVGQASAALQPVLDRDVQRGVLSTSGRAHLAAAVASIENFQELVRDVRVFRTDGKPLAGTALSDPAFVERTLREQTFVETPEWDSGSDKLVTVYVPFAARSGKGYEAVAAIDLSHGQMATQTSREARFVVATTIVACAMIFLSLLTLAIAAQRELERRRRIAETTFFQTMEGIAAIVDQRDPYTAGHSQRVADYSVAIARHLRRSAREIDDVRAAALLHDLGKIGVPDEVLLKPASLDERERAMISQHPTIAYRILAPVEAMASIAPCVLHHHERLDGTGYPSGLAGERIPLLSRIIAVADTYDAMTSNRPYRAALDAHEAKRRLLAGAGTQWDPVCVDAAIACIEDGTMAARGAADETFGQRLRAMT